MRIMREAKNGGLQGLKNISWLSSRQRKRLADALVTSRIRKGGIIFDKKRSPESA